MIRPNIQSYRGADCCSVIVELRESVERGSTEVVPVFN